MSEIKEQPTHERVLMVNNVESSWRLRESKNEAVTLEIGEPVANFSIQRNKARTLKNLARVTS